MQIVFGPVLSRRFGVSLGVDLSPSNKQCNFDCVYCELSAQKPVIAQTNIVALSDVMTAIKEALRKHAYIDVLTFTANGEPTLYPFLEDAILQTKEILREYSHIKTLLLSNGSRFSACKSALRHFDIVKFSLDSVVLKNFKRVDKPNKSLDLEDIKWGLRDFAKDFQGDLIAEILIVKGLNDDVQSNEESAKFLRELPIKRLDLSTIDRPSAYKVQSVSNQKLYELSEVFYGLNVCVVTRKNDTININKQNLQEEELINLLKRRPLSAHDCENLLTYESFERLKNMEKYNQITMRNIAGVNFYCVNH